MLINGKDLGTWGCCLEDGDPFLIPHPIKPFPRNDNRLKHGVDVLRDAPRFDIKEFTLVFGFGSGNDLTQRINDFVMEIYKGGNVMYYKGVTAVVDYLSCTEFESINEVGKLAVRFESSSPFVKETATGYGTINLPDNVLSGVADVRLNGLTAKNRAYNGSFSNGGEGWSKTTGVDFEANRAVAEITSGRSFVELTDRTTYSNAGKSKRYFRFDVEMIYNANDDVIAVQVMTSEGLKTAGSGVIKGGERIVLSAVYDSDITSYIRLLMRGQEGVKFICHSYMTEDLTQAFGAGNEPTKEQCDLMFPNWFDGTKSVTTPMRVRGIGDNLAELNSNKLLKYYLRGSYSDAFLTKNSDSTAMFVKCPKDGVVNVLLGGSFKGDVFRSAICKEDVTTGKDSYTVYSLDYTQATSRILIVEAGDYIVVQFNTTFFEENLSNLYVGYSDTYSKYQESRFYIKTKAQLESVGVTKDFIKDGLLHKNIKGGVVLDKPITTPIQTSGQVVVHPNGSIFIEPIVAVAGIYTDKAGIPDSSLPLLQLDELMVIDHETGREERLDVSKAVITESSFTHPDLKEGDTVFFEYYYDLNPIYRLNEVEYLNSNVVTKEMADKGLIK